MMYLKYLLLFSTLILNVRSEDHPPFYALDLDDGKGVQLLASWDKSSFYRSKISVIQYDVLYLYKNSGNQWFIADGGSYKKQSNKYHTVIEDGNILFTHPDPTTFPP